MSPYKDWSVNTTSCHYPVTYIFPACGLSDIVRNYHQVSPLCSKCNGPLLWPMEACCTTSPQGTTGLTWPTRLTVQHICLRILLYRQCQYEGKSRFNIDEQNCIVPNSIFQQGAKKNKPNGPDVSKPPSFRCHRCQTPTSCAFRFSATPSRCLDP